MRKKRTPWPRWTKLLRNLLLAALLGFLMWDLWDQPTLSYTADLRRKERQMLVPEAETVVELDTAGRVRYRIELTDDAAGTMWLRVCGREICFSSTPARSRARTGRYSWAAADSCRESLPMRCNSLMPMGLWSGRFRDRCGLPAIVNHCKNNS